MARVKQASSKISVSLMLGLIKIYRYCISPLLGQHCRFYPSSSQYSMTAIERFGAIKGGWLGILRIFRCHPWHKGGIDLVPDKHK